MSDERCKTCQRDPKTVNNAVSECSHIECPNRVMWGNDYFTPRWRKKAKPVVPYDKHFDKLKD